jgi:hypothetical protein
MHHTPEWQESANSVSRLFPWHSRLSSPSTSGPCPGPALLDDSESNMLDTFSTPWEQITLITTTSSSKPLLSKNEGEPSFNWAEDLPPTFHGSTTSLPQPAMVSHNLSNAGYGRPRIDAYIAEAQSKTTSAEVLAAASTLFRNGQSSQTNGIFGGSIFPAHDTVDGLQGNTSSGSSSGSQSMGHTQTFCLHLRSKGLQGSRRK